MLASRLVLRAPKVVFVLLIAVLDRQGRCAAQDVAQGWDLLERHLVASDQACRLRHERGQQLGVLVLCRAPDVIGGRSDVAPAEESLQPAIQRPCPLHCRLPWELLELDLCSDCERGVFAGLLERVHHVSARFRSDWHHRNCKCQRAAVEQSTLAVHRQNFLRARHLGRIRLEHVVPL